MNKEDIENRILVCEIRKRDYLEVGNTKTADKYKNEIHKWEKLLNQLNPEMEKELRDYKKGFYNLKLALNEIREYIESLPTKEHLLDTYIPKDVKKHILQIIDKVVGNEE